MREKRDPVPRAKEAWWWLGGLMTLGLLGAGVVAAGVLLWENMINYVISGPPPAASWQNYGAGWPGTLGIPLIAVDALPVLGTTVGLSLSNSRGVSTQAVLLIGLDSLAVTVKGGTLLVDALLTLPLVLPPGSIALPGSFPNDPALCGLSLYVQSIQADPGASHGAAFSRGLRLVLGE